MTVDDGGWEQFWDTDGRLKGYAAPPAVQSVAVEKRIPGRSRPAAEVLRECEAAIAETRARYKYPLNLLLVPDVKDLYRWRIQLTCGCVREKIVYGDEQLPLQERYHGYITQDLPRGQALCDEHSTSDWLYQPVVAWHDRRETTLQPSDPGEKRPADPEAVETWELTRRHELKTVAFWTVELSCRHRTETIAPSLEWKPADGSQVVDEPRHREMLAELEELDGTDAVHAHIRRMVQQRFPIPQTEQTCHICPRVQTIVAYQRVGWVLARGSALAPEAAAQKRAAALKKRLARAEDEATRLRAELAEAEREARSPRGAQPGQGVVT